MLGQILNQATSGQAPSPAWMARREAMLEPEVVPPLDLAKLKQADYARPARRVLRSRGVSL